METQRSEAGDSLAKGDDKSRSVRIKEKAIRETKRFIGMFLYLWVIFILFQLYNSLLNDKYNVTIVSHTLAVINALIFAKIMLVAENLRVGRRFEDKPLIYPIVIKSLLFALVFVAFHVAESLIGGALAGRAIAQSLPMLSHDGVRGLLTLAAIVTIALVPFFVYTEIERIIGPEQLRAIILKARRSPPSN